MDYLNAESYLAKAIGYCELKILSKCCANLIDYYGSNYIAAEVYHHFYNELAYSPEMARIFDFISNERNSQEFNPQIEIAYLISCSFNYPLSDQKIYEITSRVIREDIGDLTKWAYFFRNGKQSDGQFKNSIDCDKDMESALKLDQKFLPAYFEKLGGISKPIHEPEEIHAVLKCLEIDASLRIPLYFLIAERSQDGNVRWQYYSMIIDTLPDSDKRKLYAYAGRARISSNNEEENLFDLNEIERIIGKLPDEFHNRKAAIISRLKIK